ncbi:MAG: mechanosensitive ion channel domain-containing protein [Pseudomonadales bacterium]
MDGSFFARYPEIIAVLVALAGFVAAAFVSRWLIKALQFTELTLRRISPITPAFMTDETSYTFARRVTYYLTLAFFLLLALRILGVVGLTEWLDVVLAFIPQIIIGGLIILLGWFLGMMAYTLVASLLQPGRSNLLPRLAQIIVIVTAIMTGLAQMNLDLSFIANVLMILIGTFLGGMALAFAIGSRQLVANLLARRDLDHYHPGDRIRVNNIEGTIIEITGTTVVLEAGEGLVTVPTSIFSETEILRLRESTSDEINEDI